MGNSLLAYNEETEGPIKGYKYPLSDKAKEEIKKQEEEEEEENYPSPIAMGLLGAGASMLRQSGWRDTPITLGEQIGHAIPHGMQAYYQQDILNQQEQAAIAEAEQEAAQAQAEADNLQAFHATVLDAPGLNDAQRNNIIAMSKLGKDGIKKAMDRFTELQTRGEEWTDPYVDPLNPEIALKKNLKTNEVVEAFKLPDMSDWRDLEMLDEKDKVMKWFRVSPDGQTKIMLGPTGKASGVEKFEYQQARDVLTDQQFEKQFGLQKDQFENLKENQMRDYDFKVRVDERDFTVDSKRFKDEMALKVAAGELKQAQADRAILEFDKQFKFQQEKWAWTKDFEQKKWGWTKEQAVQEQENWNKQFEWKRNESKANRDQRVKEHAHTIVQDGIRNGFTREQIDNQLMQFEKRFEAEGIQFDKNFNRGVLEFEINNNLKVKAAELDLDKFLYAQQRNTEEDRQWLVELDRKLKNDEISVAQWREEMDRKINRDAVTDDQWKQGLDLQWEKHKQKIIEDAKTHDIKLVNLDLAKEKFHAEIEQQMWERDYKMNVVPRTLIGEEAISWARANKIKFDTSKGNLIVRLDKHGNLKGTLEESITYHKLEKLNKEQRGYVKDLSKDWNTSVEVKQANKMAILLQSLEGLGAEQSGVKEFAMIYKFMKSLDPTSTVLASEFKNAATAGLAWHTSLKQWAQKGLQGIQLQPKIKAEIIAGVKELARKHWVAMDGQGLGDIRTRHLANAKLLGLDENDASPLFKTALDDIFKTGESPGTKEEVDPEIRKEKSKNIDLINPSGPSL